LPTPNPSIPRSVLFQAPGRPLPASQQRQSRERLVAQILAVAGEAGWQIREDDPTASLLRLETDSLPPGRLGDLLEILVKRAVAGLDADLIGGPNVTRLDGTVTCSHARLPYRKALRIANGRGWSLALGEEIPRDAQATLIRFCGLLPIQVLCLPGQPRPASFPPDGTGVLYLLPLAGEAVRARAKGEAGSVTTVVEVDLDRLLQFCLGLAEPACA